MRKKRWKPSLYITRLKEKWDSFGRTDPLWSILSNPEKQGNKWQIGEFFDTGKQFVQSLMEDLSTLGVEVHRGRALDFGCGVGRLTQSLAPYFEEVHGVDIAPSMIALAREYNRFGDRCRYHLNTSSDLHSFADGSVDFVCSYITLQHVQPRLSRRYIKEFLRVLAPRGVLVFQLPSEPSSSVESPWLMRAKLVVKPMVPTSILNVYRELKGVDQPVMDMFGIPKSAVIRLVEGNQGQVVDVKQDGSEHGWISLQYCVTK